MQRALVLLAVAACGSSSPPPATTQTSQTVSAAGQERAQQQQREREQERIRRDHLVAEHRKIEEQQQDALGATCTEGKPGEPTSSHERCLPSCYTTEPTDPRAGKKLTGRVAIPHLVCEPAAGGTAYVFADEVEAAKLAPHPVRGRPPAAHKKGTWQATVETALAEVPPKLAKGDAIVVTGTWRSVTHPFTKQRLRCVNVSHIVKAMHHTLDGCGGDGSLGCEATGDAAARGINVVHYRVVEARRLQAAGKTAECQQAALEAVAVARGMPRWRQYAKLNVDQWKVHAAYRTRFDGVLDEDGLFAAVATLGSDAESVYAACGGPAGAPTTALQEQSFHTCW